MPFEDSCLGKRRAELVNKTDSQDFSDWACCKRFKCFQKADLHFLRAQRKMLLEASQRERKECLLKMLQADKTFFFNRTQVCTRFLQGAFGFSKDLQRSVKGTEFAPSPSCPSRLPRMKVGGNQRNRVVVFMNTFADRVADEMPDTSERHLPQHQKKLVYDLFVREFNEEGSTDIQTNSSAANVPSFSYFVRTWKEYLPAVKVRRVSRFAKCADCVMLRARLSTAKDDRSECEELKRQRRAHLHFVQMERAGYISRAQMARTEPNRFLSIIVDGADQSSFGLPHFAEKSKNTTGEALGVKVVGLLQHGSMEKLSLFTLTDEFQLGANHVIECIHRWLNKESAIGLVQKTLFVQLDNTSRDNKNRYLLGYLECLVAWGVFDQVQASFLPVGHTHADIDQKFSCTSKRLRVSDAVTLTDLQEQLRQSFATPPTVTSLDHVANISSLLRNERNLRDPPTFSENRFFRFQRATGKPTRGTGTYTTSCSVKKCHQDEWLPLFPSRPSQGLLKFAPDLSLTPVISSKPPGNYAEIVDRLSSEEGRINNSNKFQELSQLAAKIYSPREDVFHWNLRKIIESNARKYRLNIENDADETITYRDYVPRNRMEIEVNSYVVVRPKDQTQECPFWIAQVLQLLRNWAGDVSAVKVRWFEAKDGGDVYTAVYEPSLRLADRRRKTRIAWIDEIYVDSLFFQFEKLTAANRLGKVTARRIQQAVHSHEGGNSD